MWHLYCIKLKRKNDTSFETVVIQYDILLLKQKMMQHENAINDLIWFFTITTLPTNTLCFMRLCTYLHFTMLWIYIYTLVDQRKQINCKALWCGFYCLTKNCSMHSISILWWRTIKIQNIFNLVGEMLHRKIRLLKCKKKLARCMQWSIICCFCSSFCLF